MAAACEALREDVRHGSADTAADVAGDAAFARHSFGVVYHATGLRIRELSAFDDALTLEAPRLVATFGMFSLLAVGEPVVAPETRWPRQPPATSWSALPAAPRTLLVSSAGGRHRWPPPGEGRRDSRGTRP